MVKVWLLLIMKRTALGDLELTLVIDVLFNLQASSVLKQQPELEETIFAN